MRTSIARLAIVATLLATLGCRRATDARDPEAPVLELRDNQGALRLAIFALPDGFRWVATEGREEGRFMRPPSKPLQGLHPRYGPVEIANRGPDDLVVSGRDGVAWRLSRESTPAGLLRLGDGAGIPIARARFEGEEAIVRDAGGVVVLRARPSGGRIVVSDREGATVALVVGAAPLERAALAALSTLGAADRALLLFAGVGRR